MQTLIAYDICLYHVVYQQHLTVDQLPLLDTVLHLASRTQLLIFLLPPQSCSVSSAVFSSSPFSIRMPQSAVLGSPLYLHSFVGSHPLIFRNGPESPQFISNCLLTKNERKAVLTCQAREHILVKISRVVHQSLWGSQAVENRVSRAFVNKKIKKYCSGQDGSPWMELVQQDLQLKPCFLLFCFQYFFVLTAFSFIIFRPKS